MSAPTYPTYKDSGVEWLGAIPSHWRLRRLGHFFAERRDKVSDVDYLPLSVTKRGVVPQLDKVAKTDDGDNRKRVARGDFVINSRSDRKGSGGISPLDGSVSLINTVLVPTQPLASGFIGRLLTSIPFQEEFYRFGKGIVADLWSTNYSEMRNILLALPSVAEQSTIAAFLDRETGKIDALVAEQERLIALLQEKRQAVISQAVTKGLDPNVPMKPSGVDWLGEVPASWTVAPVSARYDVQLGRMLNVERSIGPDMRPYLRVFDVQWGKINIADLPEMDFPAAARERYALAPGDLLVNEGGSYVGRAAIWRGELQECYYQKALHRLRPILPDRDAAEFFYYLMEYATKRGVFIYGGNQTTIDHLTAEQLRRYRFAFPPKDEQLEITEVLSTRMREIDALAGEADRLIALLQERRAALISAAVTGKIDVRNLVQLPTEPAIAA